MALGNIEPNKQGQPAKKLRSKAISVLSFEKQFNHNYFFTNLLTFFFLQGGTY